VKIYNRYILTVALLLFLTTIILIATGQNSLEIYYTSYVIEALIVTELYVSFNRKARRGLNLVSAILFGGFAVVLCLQVLRILA
jgi:ABC-type cobalamin transport system permease subunit